MIRYAIFLAVAIASVATAIAAVGPAHMNLSATHNVTVIQKNQAFPVVGPLVVQECQQDDCSDVASTSI